jgi:hypothetical protein
MQYIFDAGTKGFTHYFFAALGEIPSIIVALIIIDMPGWGRKNSIFICMILGIVTNYLCFSVDFMYLPTFMALSRLLVKECQAMLYPYTVEIYRTNVRTSGFGTASGIGNIGAAMIPQIILHLN